MNNGKWIYYVVTMKMKWNWKSNWTVSFMETLKLAKAARKEVDNSTYLHSDSFEINTSKSQGNE